MLSNFNIVLKSDWQSEPCKFTGIINTVLCLTHCLSSYLIGIPKTDIENADTMEMSGNVSRIIYFVNIYFILLYLPSYTYIWYDVTFLVQLYI